MLIYVASALLGITTGVITGVIPGLHPNTVIFTSMPIYLNSNVILPVYLSFLTGLSVSHTFHDFLPAIFLSAPEAEAALSAAAAPEMVKEGRGLEAFHQTVYGGLFSVIGVLVILLPVSFILRNYYPVISGVMEYVLMFFLIFIVLDSDEILSSTLIVVFSGALGVLSFQSPVSQQFVLLPVFSGLFGLPSILQMLRTEFSLPDQKMQVQNSFSSVKGSLAGTVSGLFAGVVPGIGAAVSTSFLMPMVKGSKKSFLAAMGAVNTSDIIFSLLTLQLIGKARSGVSVALKALSTPSSHQLKIITALTIFSVFLSGFIALKVSKYYVKLIGKLSISKVLYLVFFAIVGSVYVLTGVLGLYILGLSSLIGHFALVSDNRRSCMAVLILPAILFFTKAGIFM